MNIDFELVTYDFVAVFREAEGNTELVEKGIQVMRQVVLDKMACQMRMFFLDALDPHPTTKEQRTRDHLKRCIDIIAELDFERALAAGKVTLRDLAELASNSDTLWQLHCALCSPVDDLASPHAEKHD